MMRNAQLNRIPSIELQLLKWIELVDEGNIPDCVNLQRAGTRLWIKRARQRLPGFGDDVRVLTLSNVQVNRRSQGKGWFTGFLDLCDTLMPWPALYVECVQNKRLANFLSRQGFIALQHDNFYRPSKRWRAINSWTSEDISDAQRAANSVHVRSLFDEPAAIAELAGMLNLPLASKRLRGNLDQAGD